MLKTIAVTGDFWTTVGSLEYALEGYRAVVYNDSKGIPTIGIGEALVIQRTKNGPYEALTLDELNALFQGVRTWITSEITQLQNAAARLNGDKTKTNPFPSSTASQTPSAPGVNVLGWSITLDQAKQVFSNDAATRKVALKTALGNYTDGSGSVWDSLEGTREGAAIYSLYFNLPKLIGPQLIAALQSGNRAEAWYQIRYQSNGGDHSATGRRYYESELFGLYSTPIVNSQTDVASYADSTQAYAVLQQHRAEILAYEKSHGIAPDGTGSSTQLNQYASTVLSGVGTIQPLSVVSEFQPAENGLFAQLRTTYANDTEVLSILNQESLFNATNIYVSSSNNATPGSLNVATLPGTVTTGDNLLLGGAGNDTLVGGAGNDLLIAGTGLDVLKSLGGDDTLIGGGADQLQGGMGNDTFVVRTSTTTAGTTVITSDSGNGSVWLDGKSTALGQGLVADSSASDTWNDGNGLKYHFVSANNPTDGTLQITGGALGANEIDIQHFDLEMAEYGMTGFLGITIPQSIYLLASTSTTLPVSPVPSTASMSLHSGGEQTFTLTLDAPATDAQSITLKLSGGTSADYAIDFGNTLQPFTGAVTLTIPAGSQSVTFALVNTKPLDNAETVKLTASMTSSAPGAAVVSSLPLSVNVIAGTPNPEVALPVIHGAVSGHSNSSDPSDPVTYYDYKSIYPEGTEAVVRNLVIAGDGEGPNFISPDHYESPGFSLSQNNSIVGGKGNDSIVTGNGNSVIQGKGGNDVISVDHGSNRIYVNTETSTVGSSQSTSFILFGNGNNTIFGGRGNDHIYAGSESFVPIGSSGYALIGAGEGNNLIVGNGGQDAIFLGAGDNQVFANTKTDIATAIAYAKTGTATGQRGAEIGVEEGNNTIVGGDGNDKIVVGQGNNLIVAGPGNDSIFAGFWVGLKIDHTNNLRQYQFYGDSNYAASANYEGSMADDGVAVGLGNDTIFGGKGNSQIFLSNGDCYVDAGGGNSSIQGGMGKDTIYGSSGNVSVLGGGGDTYIDGESGNDTLAGQGGNNTIYGGSGNDVIAAGKLGSDYATSETGSNYVFGGSGNDTIYGAGGSDTLIGGSGNVTIYGGDGTEYIAAGGDGNDELWAGNGMATVLGGGGSDTIYGGSGTNVLYAGDGGTVDKPTIVVAGSGATTIYGGLGIDKLQGGSGTAVIYAGDGGTAAQHTDILVGSGDTTVHGGLGFDEIWGGTGNSILYAGDGNSTLYSGTGNTTLVSGSGDSYWVNGTSLTTDLFNQGFGNVEVATAGGAANLQFGSGINIGDLSVSAVIGSDGSAALEIDGSGSITIDGGLVGAINSVSFATGATLDLAQFIAQAGGGSNTQAGAHGNLSFSGNSGDSLNGGSGNDTLSAWGGNTTVTAGDGANKLFGGGGNDVLQGGSGQSTLVALTGGEKLIGGSGNTTLIDMTSGGLNTTMVGGAGADSFYIGRADDVIQLQPNSGNDTVFASVGYTMADNLQHLTLTGTADLVAFGNAQNDVITGNAGRDVLIAGSGDDTLVAGSGLTTMYGGSGNDTFVVNNAADVVYGQFNGGTVQSSVDFVLPDSVQNLTLTGAANLTATGNNTLGVLTGNAGNNRLIAGNGTQTLIAGTGLATLVGGMGNNTFVVNNVADIVQAKAGAISNEVRSSVDYSLVANAKLLTLTGTANLTATGNTLNDLIIGNSGNDTLIAGSGNDTLQGGSGTTTFIFNAGFGHDEVSALGAGVLQFGTGITPASLTANVVMGGDGTPALVLNAGTHSSVMIDDFGSGAFGQVRFASGTTLTLAQLLQQLPKITTTIAGDNGQLLLTTRDNLALVGGDGDDTLYGFGNNDTLTAGAGNQQLFAAGVGDVLTGGSGNDTLTGGSGNDTLAAGSGSTLLIGGHSSDVFKLAQGAVTTITATTLNGVETLRLPPGMRLSDFQGAQHNQDLILYSPATGQLGATAAVISNFFAQQPAARQWLVAGDSDAPQSLQTWSSQQVLGGSPQPSTAAATLQWFNNTQAISLIELGLQGAGLGEDAPQIIVDPNGEQKIQRYTFTGIAQNTITVADNSEADLPLAETTQWTARYKPTSSWQNLPIYGTKVIPGQHYEIPVIPGQAVSIPAGASTYNVTVNGQLKLGVVMPDQTVNVVTGTVRTLVTESSQYFDVARNFTISHITGGNGNDYIRTWSEFRGTVALGNGNNVVALGATAPNIDYTNAAAWGVNPENGYGGSLLDQPGAFVQVGDGNNEIAGTNANDVFVVGSGFNLLAGGGGSDTYYVPLTGQATDIIYDSETSAGAPPHSTNTLILPSGIRPQDIHYRVFHDPAYPNDNVLQLNVGLSNVLIVTGQSTIVQSPTETDYRLEGIQHFQFADGTVLTQAQLLTQATQLPNDFNPTVTSQDCDVQVGAAVLASSFFTASDTGNNAITWYQFRNGYDALGHFTVDGVAQIVGQSFYVPASKLSTVQYVGGSSAGADTLQIGAFDGAMWSSLAVTTLSTVVAGATKTYTDVLTDGVKTGDTWTATDGSYGTDDLHADGSTSGISYNASGVPIASYSASADGTVTTNLYTDGVITGDTWTASDGTYGSHTYSADGSFTAIRHDASGNVRTTTRDANNSGQTLYTNADGSTTTEQYVGGAVVSDSWTGNDGTHGSDVYNADGSSTGTWYDASGNVRTSARDANNSGQTTYDNVDGSTKIETYVSGFVTGDTWARTDGSYGSNTYGADGSSQSTVHYADGHTSSSALDANGDHHQLYASATGAALSSNGSSSDTFTFARGSGSDQIVETLTGSNTDQIHYAADIASDQLWFEHVGNDLVINIIGTADTENISNWYQGASNQPAQFDAGDGKVLLASQVDNLVNAMAAFAPPSAGQTTLPQTYQSSLNAVIAANWH